MLKIQNTLTKKKEEFNAINTGKVMIYHCGPTVYWVQHIGNMRGMVMADLVHRSLKYLGYEVDFVRNYTDVGHLDGDNEGDADQGTDRMEKAAKREALNPDKIANKYIEMFENDTGLLNVLEPLHKPKATEYIHEMIAMVETLLDKGYAYVTPEAVYFDISKFPDYTKLSGQKLSEQEAGAGHGEAEKTRKRNDADFVLWFFKTGQHKNALQTWESTFESPEVENGRGFPGWHIECSAMIFSLLGQTIDIHMGGIEHVPIHHTNEIAQSEAASGKPFVNYWLHNEHLTVDGKKMAKSEGTSYALSDILERNFHPLDLRYFFLQAHYRSKQNFTWEALEAAATARKRLNAIIENAFAQLAPGYEPLTRSLNSEYQQKFVAAIEDDFNVPEALAVAWEVAKAEMQPEEKLMTLLDFDRVFGLSFENSQNPHTIEDKLSAEVIDLINARAKARADKNWAEADRIRGILETEHNVLVQDTETGQRVEIR